MTTLDLESSEELNERVLGTGSTTGEFTSEAGTSGYFAYDNSKCLSIIPNAPQPGYVCCVFEDFGDVLGLTSQMLYLPKEQFDAAIKRYLASTPQPTD